MLLLPFSHQLSAQNQQHKLNKTGCPRPYFRIIVSDTACFPVSVTLINLADSIGKQNPADTPTREMTVYWGDNSSDLVFGRNDTVGHTYSDTGTFQIYSLGSDADPITGIGTCNPVLFPDTSKGEKMVIINARHPLIDVTGNQNPMEGDTFEYSVPFQSGATYNWSLGLGNIISGQGTNKVKVAFTHGGMSSITAEINTGGSCYSTARLFLEVLYLSIPDLIKAESIHIFPNPANDALNVQFQHIPNQPISIQLMDLIGHSFKSETVVNKECKLDVSGLSDGMYLIQIQTNTVVLYEKVLIKR